MSNDLFKIVRTKWGNNSNHQCVLFVKLEVLDLIKEKFKTKEHRKDDYLKIDKNWFGTDSYHPWTLHIKLSQKFDKDEYYALYADCGDYVFGCIPWYYRVSLSGGHITKAKIIYKEFLTELFDDDTLNFEMEKE